MSLSKQDEGKNVYVLSTREWGEIVEVTEWVDGPPTGESRYALVHVTGKRHPERMHLSDLMLQEVYREMERADG